jgi:hypothetical protein
MANYISSGLRSIDYFSQPIQITFNKKRSFATVLGGFLSLIIYCVTITLIFNSANGLLNKVNPKTTMTDSALFNAPLLNLTEQNLIYAVTILNRNFESFYDDTIFTMEFSQFKRQRQNDGSMLTQYIKLNQTKCTMYEEEFKRRGFYKNYIANDIQSGVCFDNTSPGLVIGGDFGSDYFSNINFKIKRCVNSTNSKVICKSKDVIDDKLLNGYFQWYYFGNNIDINNYLNPYSISFANYFIVLDPKASKFIDIFFKTVNISSDAGLIFESYEYKSALVYENSREQILVQVVDDLVIDFYMGSSKNYLTYTRIYQKFQDFAANIGGLLKVMTVIAYFISIKFTHFSMYEKMFRSLYNFDYGDEEEKNKIENSSINKFKFTRKFKGSSSTDRELSSNRNLSSKRSSSNNSPKKNKYEEVAENSKQTQDLIHKQKSIDAGYENYKFKSNNSPAKNKPEIIVSDNTKPMFYTFDTIKSNAFDTQKSNAMETQIIVKKQEKFNLHIRKKIASQKRKYASNFLLEPFDVIKLYLCNCCIQRTRTKLNLFKLAFNKLHQYLDYLQIIQTLQQFHRLKNVIFSKTQKELFLSNSKEVISEINKNSKDLDNRKGIEKSDENQNIYENYLKAKKKKNSSKIYKRLLKNLDENLKKIFENTKN